MKNFIFILSLVFSLSSFGQFNEIAFVNNTNGDVEILLYFSGDGACETTACDTGSITAQFTLAPGLTEIEQLTDFDDLAPEFDNVPFNLCETFQCTFLNIYNSICGESFEWNIVSFGHENWEFCCTGRVGDLDCGTNLTYADNLVEAEWIEDANGDITVINNP